MNRPAKKARLGKGLGALLGEYMDEAPSRDAQLVGVKSIGPNPQQPRKTFSTEELTELAQSIKENGLLQPLLIRPAPRAPGKYELVAGERRLRAVQKLGWKQVPAVIREVDDDTLLVLALVENLQREALNPMEEAEGVPGPHGQTRPESRPDRALGRQEPLDGGEYGPPSSVAGLRAGVCGGRIPHERTREGAARARR